MLLIQYGADLDLPDAEYKVPLLHAILSNSVDIVKLLLQAGASVALPKSLTHYITPPFIVACKKGNVQIVSALISTGVDIDEFDVLNMSALYVAVAYGNTQVVRALLQAGSDPNIPDLPNSTPLAKALLMACRKGNLSITKLLINHGANAYRANKAGHTSLHIASGHGLDPIAKALLQAGMDPDVPDVGGWTSLMMASEAGNTETCQTLLRYSADLDRKNDTGCTALFFAVSGGNIDTAKLLLSHGADPNTADNSGFHVLMMAVNLNNSDLIRLLFSSGADIDMRDSCNDNPLLLAVGLGHYDSVKTLLKLNANPEASGSSGETALSISLHNNDDKMFSILTAAGCRTHYLKHLDSKAFSLSPIVQALMEDCIKQSTPSLMHITRVNIRRALAFNFEEKVDNLSLPNCLKQYLLLSDLDDINLEDSPMETD